MRSRKKWKKSNRNRQTPTTPRKTGIFYGKRSTPKVNKAVFCVVRGNVFRIDVFDVLVVVLFSFFFFSRPKRTQVQPKRAILHQIVCQWCLASH